MRRSRRAWAAGLALLGVLAASACDPGDDPTDPPTTATETSEEPTTSESPTEDVPTPPEVEAPTPAPEASVDDHVGAIYAARYFLDLYTYMRATGDTAQFEAMSAEECEFCADSITTAKDLHADGGWAEGGELRFDIEAATAEYPTEDEPSYMVRFTTTEEPSVVHHGDGSQEALKGATFDTVVALRYVDDRFIVFGVKND